MQTSNPQVIKYLISHEKALDGIYSAFAEKFATDQAFWLDIAQEEKQHARMLEDLESKLGNGVDLHKHIFKVDAVALSLEYINGLHQRLAAGDIDRIQAGALSLDLEKSLIEKGYFTIFDSDSFQIQRVFEALTKATEHHIDRVEAFLKANKLN
jgi:hypothetical protein